MKKTKYYFLTYILCSTHLIPDSYGGLICVDMIKTTNNSK